MPFEGRVKVEQPEVRAADLPCDVTQAYREVRDSIASEGLTDFERIKILASRIPAESQWPEQLDETTRQDIRDVLNILKSADKGEDPELVTARIENFAPGYQVDLQNKVLPLTSKILDKAARSRSPIGEFTEALFGESELEPSRTLLQGYKTTRAVGRVQIMDANGRHRGSGSGFLVGPGLFLTNKHVLKNAESAARSFVIFDDEEPLDGSLQTPRRFRITGDLYCSSETADFAFVSLAPDDGKNTPLSLYGFLNLIEESGKAIKNEPVSIIQHPGGRPKKIALRNSFVMGRRSNGFYYTTDTLPGTSGSPVTNSQWQVVALHHRYVPHPLNPQIALANRGVRVSSIYEELHNMVASGNQSARRVLDILSSPASSLGSSDQEFLQTSSSSSDTGGTDIAESGFILEGGPYAGLTEQEFFAAIGEREGQTDGESDIPVPEIFSNEAADFSGFTELLPVDHESVLRRIGPESYRLIIGFEVSSRANYERRLHRPIKPGGASGVTIGIGYDLGYVTLSQFRQHWRDLLSDQTMRSLEACIGKTRSAAATALNGVRDISIPYNHAIRVFKRSTLPKFFGELNRHIRDDVLDRLPPPCVGALVSLVFNRGASFQREGDRYREMRAIRQELHAGNPNAVPGLIRSMKRIWAGDPTVRGLLIRRDREADLFASGLSGGSAAAGHGGRTGYSRERDRGIRPASRLGRAKRNPDPRDLVLEAEGSRARARGTLGKLVLEQPRLRPSPCRRERRDLQSHRRPDRTRHSAWPLSASFHGKRAPHRCDSRTTIADGRDGLESASVRIVEQKPDHRTFRCLIAVYHRTQRKVSVFRASTVPNRGGVASCANRLNGFGGDLANMLPTGCYRLCVGTHFGSATIPTVLRWDRPARYRIGSHHASNQERWIYGSQDLWDRCRPADNIHPAFSASSADFSSLGCLTVPGRFANGSHTGLWAQFRKTAGFDGSQHSGTRYDLLLTTGMELAAIHNRRTGSPCAVLPMAHAVNSSRPSSEHSALPTLTIPSALAPKETRRNRGRCSRNHNRDLQSPHSAGSRVQGVLKHRKRSHRLRRSCASVAG